MSLCGNCGKPRLLDLFCCQGGATRGYQDAGFCVTGVDIDPQPKYCGDEFHQADAIGFVWAHLAWIKASFAGVHASPPCQRYSATQRIQRNDHPDLIGPTREVLIELGLPYVIENVWDARDELQHPILLCGEMFGIKTYRHRLFEVGNGFAFTPPAHPEHPKETVKMGRPLREGDYFHAVGNFSSVAYVRREMGMEWANRDGLREAVPPAMTTYIGAALLAHLTEEIAA